MVLKFILSFCEGLRSCVFKYLGCKFSAHSRCVHVVYALTCFNKLNSGFVYFSGLYGVIVNLWLLFCTF